MTRKFLFPALLASLVAGSIAVPAIATPPVLPNPQLIQPLPLICPDLRVQVRFEQTGIPGRVRGVVRVTNVSPTNFNSAAGLQRIVVRRTHGFAGPDQFGYQFHHIAHGDSREWSFVRDLNGAPIEMNAELQVMPGAYSDGNPYNNECNASNNRDHART